MVAVTVIELASEEASVTVHPGAGGRLGRLEVFGRELLHTDPARGPLGWGSYPMAPWAGRVRRGTFRFAGRDEHLPTNLPPHAIHGTAYDATWEVLDAGRDYCALQTPLAWPFGGAAHQHIHLHPAGLTCVLTVYANRTMPAVVGWHPCFVTPDRSSLEFAGMYRRDEEGIAVREIVAPKPHPWDDCFVEPHSPLRLAWREVALELTSDCDHWVVFDELPGLLCVEPQSGPPDAFNIGGASVLEPGEMLQRQLTFRWRAPDRQD